LAAREEKKKKQRNRPSVCTGSKQDILGYLLTCITARVLIELIFQVTHRRTWGSAVAALSFRVDFLGEWRLHCVFRYHQCCRSQDFCCGVQSVGKILPVQKIFEFFSSEMEYSSAFFMHNDCL